MSYKMPKAGTKSYEHLTPYVLGKLNGPVSKIPTVPEAKMQAKNYFRTSADGCTGLYTLTLLADDTVAICFYGIKGAFRKVWNFGRKENDNYI